MTFYSENAFHLLSLKDRKLLSISEEKMLIERVQKYNDEEALDILIYKNLGLIEMLANRFYNRGLDLDDLVQEGAAAFVKAVKSFDINKKYKLSTYAVPIIKRGIIRALSEGARNVRYPEREYYDMCKLEKLYHSLFSEQERYPTFFELAEHSGLDVEIIEVLLRFMSDTDSLMEPLEDETMMMYALASDEFISPEEYILFGALKDEINKMFETLGFGSIEKLIFNYYYGLNDFDQKDFTEIGKILHLHTNKIKGIHRRAINAIRFSHEALKLAMYTDKPEESIKELYVYRTRGKTRKKNKSEG